MHYVLNILVQLTFFTIFSLSIIGCGTFIKKKLFNFDFNLGEIGILGFFFIYFFSVFLNFFIPINIYLSLTVLFFGLIVFFNNYKIYFISKKYFFVLIFALSFVLSITTNLHDDHLLYQLPYIEYKQQFKIIFGLVNLNDFLAYQHGLYDVMSFFKLPFYENRLVFLIPIIFFMFCIFAIVDYFNKKENITSNLIFFIIFLILYKFTRSKEFGTDVPVIGLLFLIQIYSLNYFFTQEKKYFYKMLLMFSLAVIYKIYALLAVFYFLIFGKKVLNYTYEVFTKKKIILVFLLLLTSVTFLKNIIQSGCFSYPVTVTCIDKRILSWSAGKNISSWRNEFLKAGVKGWMPYVRDNQFEIQIFPKEYNDTFKYNFHKNVIKDPDTERILIVFLILLLVIFIDYFNKFKSRNMEKHQEIKVLLLCALIPLILWFLTMPYIRYGGYAYFPFGILILYSYFNYKSYYSSKIIKSILIIGIFFFLIKNFTRISEEVSSIVNEVNLKAYPIPLLNHPAADEKRLDNNKKIFISENNWLCSLSKLPCLPGFFENMKIQIDDKYGYNFISVNDEELLRFLNYKIKVYYLKEDRYADDENKEMRLK